MQETTSDATKRMADILGAQFVANQNQNPLPVPEADRAWLSDDIWLSIPAYMHKSIQASHERLTADLEEALRPFIFAAAVGWSVEQDVNAAKPNQHTEHPLIAFGAYAGQYAAQSRVSWADWLRLLDACDEAGLLKTEPRP